MKLARIPKDRGSPKVALSEKLRGGYYTPVPVAHWLCRWAIRSKHDRIWSQVAETALSSLQRPNGCLNSARTSIVLPIKLRASRFYRTKRPRLFTDCNP